LGKLEKYLDIANERDTLWNDASMKVCFCLCFEKKKLFDEILNVCVCMLLGILSWWMTMTKIMIV